MMSGASRMSTVRSRRGGANSGGGGGTREEAPASDQRHHENGGAHRHFEHGDGQDQDDAGDGPTGLEAFETGRLSRSIEVPYFEIRRHRHTNSHALGQSTPSLLQALFRPSPTLRVLDIDLEGDFIVVENESKRPQNLAGYYLCDEDRVNKFTFPSNLILAPHSCIKVLCAPGSMRRDELHAAMNLDGSGDDLDGAIQDVLLWKDSSGRLRRENVLSSDADCIYLYNGKDRMMSALAMTSDGQFKEYKPFAALADQRAWRSIGLGAVAVRICCQLIAGYHALHTNIGRHVDSSNPEWVVIPLLVAVACDLLQREAVIRARLFDFCGEALSIVSDRLHAMVVYGTLAIFYTEYCSLFLLFLALDMASSWCQLFASDCGELDMRALTGTLARHAPAVLTLVCFASEAFLLLLFMDHGVVQFRLNKGVVAVFSVVHRPLLTIPVLRDLLLAAFIFKQALVISQLWFCVSALVNATFLCPTDDIAKRSLSKAMGPRARRRPNLELLHKSQSLLTFRAQS